MKEDLEYFRKNNIEVNPLLCNTFTKSELEYIIEQAQYCCMDEKERLSVFLINTDKCMIEIYTDFEPVEEDEKAKIALLLDYEAKDEQVRDNIRFLSKVELMEMLKNSKPEKLIEIFLDE